MQSIQPEALRAWLDDASRAPPLLLDVREPWEFEVCHIEGARLLPMHQVPSQVNALDAARETVVICHHGVRSFHVARFLERNGFTRVINLTGGVDAWAKQVDPSMPSY